MIFFVLCGAPQKNPLCLMSFKTLNDAKHTISKNKNNNNKIRLQPMALHDILHIPDIDISMRINELPSFRSFTEIEIL